MYSGIEKKWCAVWYAMVWRTGELRKRGEQEVEVVLRRERAAARVAVVRVRVRALAAAARVVEREELRREQHNAVVRKRHDQPVRPQQQRRTPTVLYENEYSICFAHSKLPYT